MERRKGIPLVAIIIFIALLVAIVITCTIILRTSGNENSNNNQNTASLQETNNNTTAEEPTEEEGEEIDNEDMINSDTEIQEAYKLAGNGKTFAKYAIYATGEMCIRDRFYKKRRKAGR